MLLTVKEVATRLNLSERSVQAKCRQFKIPKISNQYQLNEDVIQNWEVKPQTTETVTQRTSRTAAVQNGTSTMFVLYVVVVIAVLLLSLVIWGICKTISDQSKIIDVKTKEINTFIIDAKKANDSINVLKMNVHDLQKDLKIKNDSIRLIKKW